MLGLGTNLARDYDLDTGSGAWFAGHRKCRADLNGTSAHALQSEVTAFGGYLLGDETGAVVTNYKTYAPGRVFEVK